LNPLGQAPAPVAKRPADVHTQGLDVERPDRARSGRGWPAAAGNGRFIVLLICFGAAFGVRLLALDRPGMLVDRDFTSAIIARDFLLRGEADVPEWRREAARDLRANQPVLEPPITEYVVSQLWRIAGGERLWIARVLTSLFWLAGGVFLYRLAGALLPAGAALPATLYYLFVPSGVLLSRSFQPDALMMLLFLASLYLMVRYLESPSAWKLLLTGGIAGLGLLHRPLVVFATAGAFVAITIAHERSWKAVFKPGVLLIALLTLLPALAYYGYAIVFAGFMRWKVASSFRADLFVHSEFWRGWFDLAVNSLGLAPLLLASAGVPLLPRGMPRAMVLGLALGYVAFGLVFTMHIHTHGYYQAQAIPLVALPLGVTVGGIVARLRSARIHPILWCAPLAGMLLLSVSWTRDVRAGLATRRPETEQVSKEIGELVHHSSRVVFLSPYYGMALQYMGEFTGRYWPRSITPGLYQLPGERELSIRERLDALGFTPEYFVITHMQEFEANHRDLASYLETSCQVLAARPDYLIYTACKA
jgi:hypothetical protein